MKDKNNLEPSDYTTGVSNTLNPVNPETALLGVVKKLKALEIIKEKDVIVTTLKQAVSSTHYNNMLLLKIMDGEVKAITDEEYELLKEILL